MVNEPRRILVTGSRTWTDQVTIAEALWDAWIDLGRTQTVLVSGACKDGADRIAEQVWATNQYPVELHPVQPADWDRHGTKAGFLRNAKMVELGADVCLAFIKGESRGASMTADLATKAGIETRRFIQ